MDAQRVQTALSEHVEGYWTEWFGGPGSAVVEGLGEVKVVSAEGGEGQGDHAHIVFEVEGRFFKLDGYYASFDGFDWSYSDLYEVVPKEKVITVYER